MEEEKKRIKRSFLAGHEKIVVFTKTDYFCMNCGKKEVWDDDCDDFYQGTNFVCFACGSEWANPIGVKDCDWFDQIKKQLEESQQPIEKEE